MVVKRSCSWAVAAAIVVCGAAAGHASPCSTQIAETEQAIARVAAAKGPTAAQSIGAQLHHQPTPQSVGGAEDKARLAAAAALQRARKADAGGDARACASAVDEAKAIYGLE